jgi:hypothetical protein
MATVGLAMIVRNESQVIERCLASVRDLIDHWLVVDTGSTDKTPKLVHEWLDGIPGTLHHRPWVNFGYNRTEVVQAARVCADYTLVIDADDVLETPRGFTWPELDVDVVVLAHRLQNLTNRRATLLSTRLTWQYQGVRDEVLQAPHDVSWVMLPDVSVRVGIDGGRTRGLTRSEVRAADAVALADAVARDPRNPGVQYHLARALRDSHQYQAALDAFRNRAGMGGNLEEIADSLHEVARLLQLSGVDRETVIAAYLTAWNERPTRAEPLIALAAFAREQGLHSVARMAATQAREIPRPDDSLWIDEDAYSWRADDEYASSTFWTGAFAESARTCRHLLAGHILPAEHRDRVAANLAHADQRLGVAGTESVDEPVEEAPVAHPTSVVEEAHELPRPRDAEEDMLPAAVEAEVEYEFDDSMYDEAELEEELLEDELLEEEILQEAELEEELVEDKLLDEVALDDEVVDDAVPQLLDLNQGMLDEDLPVEPVRTRPKRPVAAAPTAAAPAAALPVVKSQRTANTVVIRTSRIPLTPARKAAAEETRANGRRRGA